MKPEFTTNRAGELVADAINGHLAFLQETLKEPPELAIASAYFNLGGFALLADQLEQLAHVRLLLGAEPQSPEMRMRQLRPFISPSSSAQFELDGALAEHGENLVAERDLLGFTLIADKSAKRLVDWLRSGKVEVRRLEDAFLHGKAFIVVTHDEAVMAGSSNFTYAGLAKNLELNLGLYQPSVVRQVASWFDDLWNRANPYELAKLYEERFVPHSPYLIYLRMLQERYGDEIKEEAREQSSGISHLTSFQRDGLWRARRILSTWRGVLIADEVGLGKTFIAGELMKDAIQTRRQRVLLIAPAALRDGPWRKFLLRQQLAVEVLSFEELADDPRLNDDASGKARLAFDPAEYAMIVIDEAHNLRTPTTARAEALRRLLSGSPPKDLVLLTATPVNNSLWDLYYLLNYFIKNDSAFAGIGIRSLRDRFASAMALNPDDLSPQYLFDILDAVAVRRTRPFVKKYYSNDKIIVDGKQVTITFPTPRVRRVSYNLDSAIPGFFARFERALDGSSAGTFEPNPNVLTLARYSPSRYRTEGSPDAYEMQLTGLLRTGLLKRFESSSHAFALTCRKMAASHASFLELLKVGKVATGAALVDWIATDSDDEASVAEYIDKRKEDLEDIKDYDAGALAANVASDRDLLLAFALEAESIDRRHDPKLLALTEQLAVIAREAAASAFSAEDEQNRRKVIIFSYFADTVDWVSKHIDAIVQSDDRLHCYKGRVIATHGGDDGVENVLWGFAPLTTDAPPSRSQDRYDILICTDVLAEGVNLQQAGNLINYDLPWNPMRLVQRHGRIDRIGSFHKVVVVRCFFPDEQLDALLGLEERLVRKLKQAAASVGLAGEVLPGSQVQDVVFAEAREQIAKLQDEDASLFERGGTKLSALSGEEYRQELRVARQDPELRARIERLAWGSGSGYSADVEVPHFVFCAKVGNHRVPQFRSVAVQKEGIVDVVDDALSCLSRARPSDGAESPRSLTDESYARAFEHWAIARESIVKDWNLLSDPANLISPISPTLNRAASIIRRYTLGDLSSEEKERTIEALQANYPERIVREVRRAMNSSEREREQVRAIVDVVKRLGLEPAIRPQPLPEIDLSDVHLVSWMCIEPD
jgi:hypothetical protein